MKLTLFSPDAFSSVILPAKCAGQYWLTGKDAAGTAAWIIAAEGVRSVEEGKPDQWILKSNSRFRIIDHSGTGRIRIPTACTAEQSRCPPSTGP